MKTIRLIAILSLVLATACGITRKTPQEKEAEARRVQEMLDSRSYTIDINYLIPRTGAASRGSSGQACLG